jgi:hypothetical protein
MTIKGKVGKCAFHYIVSILGCMRRFTDSYKQMCSCTKYVGLHTFHCLLQAKHGVMHRQFATDAQHCTRKAQAKEKERRWGAIARHPKPLLAITEGICEQWSLHAVPHWECKILQCIDNKEYPVPKEEAQKDAAAEDILFHVVYKYKIFVHKDGKEHWWLELVQKCTKVDNFYGLYYWPTLSCGWYHSTSCMLAACCWRE